MQAHFSRTVGLVLDRDVGGNRYEKRHNEFLRE